ncbi:MAG: hypothetical protein DRJ69_06960 [Thermoprotei archaeon]|nr:MAG: hypothetical protein DRJ69_06960 [Thermoprotei archaeon]
MARRLPVQVSVRLSRRDKELLDRLCEARGEEISDFIRRAIRKELARAGLLDPEEARLLEVQL